MQGTRVLPIAVYSKRFLRYLILGFFPLTYKRIRKGTIQDCLCQENKKRHLHEFLVSERRKYLSDV